MIPNVLAVAGVDPSGGAGVLADVKTISACGCFGMAVVTALTAQNTRRVFAIHAPPAEFVAAQIDAVFADVRVDAVKIGMLATAEIAVTVADRLRALRPRSVVLDPVIAASSGDVLVTLEALEVIRERLMPLAALVTPNLAEAALLVGAAEPLTNDAQIESAGARLLALGAAAALIKGGHGSGPEARDFLFADGACRVFSAPRLATSNTHGTGCALSSAIACGLARGLPLADAIEAAKRYLTGALRFGDRLDVGQGPGPIDHFWRMEDGRGRRGGAETN